MPSFLFLSQLTHALRRALRDERGVSTAEWIGVVGIAVILMFTIKTVFVNGGSAQIQAAIDAGLDAQVQRYHKRDLETANWRDARIGFYWGSPGPERYGGDGSGSDGEGNGGDWEVEADEPVEPVLADPPTPDEPITVTQPAIGEEPEASDPYDCRDGINSFGEASRQAWGIAKGVWKGGWGTLTGIFTLVWDLIKATPVYGWVDSEGHEATLTKYEQLFYLIQDAIVSAYAEEGLLGGTGEVAEGALAVLFADAIESWEAGNCGEAIGILLFEAADIIIGAKGAGKVGKVGRVAGILDEAGDLARLLGKLERAEDLTPDEAARLAGLLEDMTPEELAQRGIDEDMLRRLEDSGFMNPCRLSMVPMPKAPGLAKMALAPLGGCGDIISPDRQQHILYGDSTGGGHLWAGTTGKDTFSSIMER